MGFPTPSYGNASTNFLANQNINEEQKRLKIYWLYLLYLPTWSPLWVLFISSCRFLSPDYFFLAWRTYFSVFFYKAGLLAMNSFSLCLSGCVCISLHVWRIILLDTENSTVFSFSTLTMTTCYLLVSIISKDNPIVVFFYMMSHFTADTFKTLSLMTFMIVITFDYDTCRCDFFFFSLSSDICWVYCRHILMAFFKPTLGKIQLLFLKKIILCLSPMVSQNFEALFVLHILLSFCSLDSFYRFISKFVARLGEVS